MRTITQIQTALLALNEHYDEDTIATKLGVSKRTVYKWWVGTMPRPKTRLRIANLLCDIRQEEKRIEAEKLRTLEESQKAEKKAKLKEEIRIVDEIYSTNNIDRHHRYEEMKKVFWCPELEDSFAVKVICWRMRIKREWAIAAAEQTDEPRTKTVEELHDIVTYMESTYRPFEQYILAYDESP